MTIPSNKEGQPDTVLENFRPGTYLFESLRQISAEEIKRVKAFLDGGCGILRTGFMFQVFSMLITDRTAA